MKQMPPYLNAAYEGDDLFTGGQLRAALSSERDTVLEEVAQEIERFTFAFGVDTVHSFAAFVRGMKS